MFKYAGFIAMLLVAGLRSFAAGPSTDRDGITFQFHPPEAGITLIHTARKMETETTTSDGKTETNVTVTIEKEKMQIVKTARGYTLTSIALSVEKAVNDEAQQPDGFDQASMLVPVTVEVDKAGRIIAIRGLDAVRTKALELMEGNERDFYEKIMTKERMESLTRSEWAATNSILFGLTKQPGDTWQSKIKWFVFSPSLLPVTTDYSFIRMYNMAGHQCAMLKNVIEPDLQTAGQDLKQMFTDLGILPKGLDAKFSVQAFSEEHIQYLDPETFITWKETESMTKKYTVTLDGRDIVTTNKLDSTITTEVANDARDT